ncbi:MAG: hypothetical protein WCK67_00485 [bacterium]
MFRCKNCNSSDKFTLMLSPNYKGKGEIKQSINNNDQIVLNVDGYTFVPDIDFMNGHACCEYCGTIKMWEIYFED